MYAAKFTLFYVIAALAALASASPVPVPAPEAQVISIDVVAREPLALVEAVVAREPTPAEDVDVRSCRTAYSAGGCL